MNITIILAEDHHIVREGVRVLLQNQPDFSVVSEAADGLTAVQAVEELKPDILLVDLMMPGLGGLEVTRKVTKTSPNTKVIVLSMYRNEPYVIEALRNGARGYVLKESSVADLVEAIRAVAAGHRFLSPSLSDRAIDTYLEKTRGHAPRRLRHAEHKGKGSAPVGRRGLQQCRSGRPPPHQHKDGGSPQGQHDAEASPPDSHRSHQICLQERDSAGTVNRARGKLEPGKKEVIMKEQRRIPPLVSTEWLEANLSGPGLVVVDVREKEEYEKGHISGALNSPFPRWVTERNGLLLEVPSDEDLLNVISDAGIDSDSAVVVVNKTDTQFNRADATRVAWTLAISGVRNAAVLDGGFNKWSEERRILSTLPATPVRSEYRGRIDRSSIVAKDYVLSRIGKSLIVDARTTEDFFGVTTADFAPRAGHIAGAQSMPVPWLYELDGTFRSIDDIRRIAEGVVGKDRSAEIIVYCGVGGFTSTWVFLLVEMFDYTNVKFYDG